MILFEKRYQALIYLIVQHYNKNLSILLLHNHVTQFPYKLAVNFGYYKERETNYKYYEEWIHGGII